MFEFDKLLVLVLAVVTSATVSQVAECQVERSSHYPMFEDDRIRVAVPRGWSVQDATEHVGGNKPFDRTIGALLTKGNYRLYLLTHKGQASGIEGGRFSEVVEYVSPWIDMSEGPWLPCPFEIQGSAAVTGTKLTRKDLYFDTAHASKKSLADCGNANVKGTLWYGSYFVETCREKDTPRGCDGFFLTYKDLSGKPPRAMEDWQMVYTISFDTNSPDTLPTRGDPVLRAVLREANRIVGSIAYK